MSTVVRGADGRWRCPWGASSAEYIAYHDDEWGRPVHGEAAYFERLTLEGFQSGLSWLTILRKREGFRAAFAGFDADVVAAYGDLEQARLMADPGIVRNRLKIQAAVTNARATVALREEGGLSALVDSFRPPEAARAAPVTTAEVPASTPESSALAKALKRRGFVFVGPTTMYALMQAIGVVDDHLAECHCRGLS
ncbi:MAG: DNA-3-methyladenine glycosylase I [Nocardioides sp.]